MGVRVPGTLTDKSKKPKKQKQAVCPPIARLTPESFVRKTADQETLDRLLKEVKRADKKLWTARNSLHFGFIDQDQLNEVAAEYEVALASLRKAGDKAGSGGRCLGQMSGLTDTISRIKKICLACRFVKMTDLNSDVLSRWLQDKTDDGMEARTRNSYREPMNTFGNWAVSKGFLHYNPFKTIPKLREEIDVRHERRAFTGEEIEKLLKAAEKRPLHDVTIISRGPRKGTFRTEINERTRKEAIRLGLERRLIYATLLYTGLRKNELASITFGQVFLNDKIPHIYTVAG